MEALISYFSVIDPRLLQHIKGKPAEFIRLLQERTYLSEEAFKEVICQRKYNDKYYRTLKSRTIKILQALALISTARGENLLKKKYDNCQKNFAVGQKFLTKGDRKEGLRLIKRAYSIAVEYNFVYFACELASILYHDHVYYHRNEKKAAFYAKQVRRYLHDYVAEKHAEDHFYQVIGKLNGASDPTPIQEAIIQLEQYKGESIKYKGYATTLKILYGFHTGNYKNIIKDCSQVLQSFEGEKGVHSSHYHLFHKAQGIAYMATANYIEANDNFQEARHYASSKSFNYYSVRLYETINALHAGQYQKAYDLHRQNKRCKVERIRQQFVIIEAYLCFLAYTGHLQLDKPFRLGKYLNETFKAQTDKQGDNISILIAELLVYFSRDRGKLTDRIDAIKHYTYRHLKSKDTQRAKSFIKILCLLPRANFNPTALARLAKKHIYFLETHPIQLGDNIAIEILPFNDLLVLLLENLNRKVA